ncbi:MAG: ABC transporter permease [Anaerolineaceae bacterium]|nr:ABC transporter permease [Anaerolineaceae bacterium]
MSTHFRQFIIGAKVAVALYIADMSPWTILGVDIPRALLQALFFVAMASAAGGETLARFALIGNAIQVAVLIAIVFMAGVIETEKWAGTLVYWIASPSKWLPTMLGRSVAEFGHVLFTSAIIFAVFVPIIAPDIRALNLLRAVPVILITLLSACTIGWLIGAIALPVRWGTMIGNLVAYSMMILCGINFPVSSLPPVVQSVSSTIPVTNGLLAIRGLIDGATYMSVLPLVGKEVVIAIIFGTLAWLCFGYRLYILRKGGNLDLM